MQAPAVALMVAGPAEVVTRFAAALTVLALAACGPPSTGAQAQPPPPPVGVSVAPPADAPSADKTCGGAPLTVTFYDAGQALAVLVTLPDGRRIVVDTGENPRRPGCGGPCAIWNRRVVAGLLADLQGAPVDMLWITHQHSDHHGGLPTLAASPGFRVAHYVDNGTRRGSGGVKAARAAARDGGAVLHEVYPGRTDIPIPDTADVQILAIVPARSTPGPWHIDCDKHPNACSIGLKVSYCHSSVLFTGDVEEDTEMRWATGDIDLLQVAHHGSNTSSKQPFIDLVKPEYAVIVSGKQHEGTNRTYCHPRKETVDRLTAATGGAGSRTVTVYDASARKCNAQRPDDWKTVNISDSLWLTAYHGTVSLVTNGDGSFERL